MVEVFKTDVQRKAHSKMLVSVLTQAFPAFKINFDLSDCDRVLRVEGEEIFTSAIAAIVTAHGFHCEILD